MNDNLFANVEVKPDVKMKSNSYTEVLEKRKRPAIPDEPVKYEISDEKLLATETIKKPKPELQVYSNEDVKKKATEYFKGDELAGNVWMNKYALKDSKGNLYEQTPEEMHWRLAGEIARIERKYPNPMSKEDIFILLKDFKYIIPQGE